MNGCGASEQNNKLQFAISDATFHELIITLF